MNKKRNVRNTVVIVVSSIFILGALTFAYLFDKLECLSEVGDAASRACFIEKGDFNFLEAKAKNNFTQNLEYKMVLAYKTESLLFEDFDYKEATGKYALNATGIKKIYSFGITDLEYEALEEAIKEKTDYYVADSTIFFSEYLSDTFYEKNNLAEKLVPEIIIEENYNLGLPIYSKISLNELLSNEVFSKLDASEKTQIADTIFELLINNTPILISEYNHKAEIPEDNKLGYNMSLEEEKDIKLFNDTNILYYIYFLNEAEGLRISIRGADLYYVKLDKKISILPKQTITILNSDLEEETEIVTEEGHDGKSVELTRRVYTSDHEFLYEQEVLNEYYFPKHKIIEFN